MATQQMVAAHGAPLALIGQGYNGQITAEQAAGMTQEQLREAAAAGLLRQVMADQAIGPGQDQQPDTYRFQTGPDQWQSINSFNPDGSPVIGEQYTPFGNKKSGALFGALAGGMGAYSAFGAGAGAGGGGSVAGGIDAGVNAGLAGGGGGSVLGGGGSVLGGGGGASLLGGVGSALSGNPALTGALLGGVLGGVSGSSDATQSQTTTNTNAPSQAYLDYAVPALNKISDYGSGSSPYTGPTTAAGSATLGQAGAAYGGLSSAGNAEMPGVRDLVSKGTQGYTAATNPYAEFGNPYVQDTIDAASRGYVRNFNEVVAPKFASASSFGNQGVGTAEARDRATVSTTLGDIGANVGNNAYNVGAQLAESGAGRQDAASQFGLSSSLSGAGILGGFGESAAGRADASALARASGLAQVGGLEQQNNQFNVSSGLQAHGLNLQDLQSRMAALQSGLGVNLGGTSSSTSSSTTPGNVASGVLGGAVVGSQVGGAFADPKKKKTATAGLFGGGTSANLFGR